MTWVGETIVLVFFFPPSTPFSTLFSWLVIGAEKRGAMGLAFQLISGF